MTGNDRNALGIYVSIPFCRSKCTYCNFASGVYPAKDHERYVDRLIEDLSGARSWATMISAQLPRCVDTVYLGGGTPSLLEPALLTRLFVAIQAQFELDAHAEITMECAPGQITDVTLNAMVAAGVNRVSLGVQSFVDSEAHASGRLHSHAIVEEDLRRLRAAGIANLNVDLIAGLPGQTFASWEESLDALIHSGVPHASVYMLEVDEDSRLGREMLKGAVRYRADLVPHDDAIARMYERAIERLESAGLCQYEISNFARTGFESKHNMRYWQRRPYLGVGLDASSMLREASFVSENMNRVEKKAKSPGASAPAGRLVVRFTTTDDLKEYLVGPATPEMTRLSPAQQLEEAWFLGLRMNEGVDPADLAKEFGSEMLEPATPVTERLIDDGLLIADRGRVQLTARGRLLSNDVFQEFLETEVAAAVFEA